VETVVEYDIGCLPELAVSGPLLMADDERLVFSFNATCLAADGYHREDAGRAVVRVQSCLAFKLGYPNDEARPGHPLYGRGFVGTAVYEVLESSWVAELARQNRVRFPDSDVTKWGARHFLFAFHETTLEVLGRTLEVSLVSEPLAVEISRMRAWLVPEAEPGAAADGGAR
jgi:Fe-S oxidoreductase